MTDLSLKGTRILIVEDNYVVADALRYLIDGYEGVVTAVVPSVELAMAALAEQPIDIAVLDINLRGASVVPLAEHLRANGIPFVFLTGYGDSAFLPDHLREQPRFDKPVQPERLVATIVELTGRGR